MKQTLDAEIRAKADAERYRQQQEAEADLFKRQKEAEARRYEKEQEAATEMKIAEAQKYAQEQEAEGIAAIGRAEAEAIRAKTLAEAEGIDKKAEAMTRPRERNLNDKIKRGRIRKDVSRQLTAKFRKELAQRNRSGAESYEAQAVDQTEEVAAAAVEEVTEQAGWLQRPALLKGNDQIGHSPRYGGAHHTPETPKENRALENPSINQSIKERLRRSTGLKEKPPGGAFVTKARKSVEQAAQKGSSLIKASAAAGKTPATRKVMERAQKKALREAQRKMLQRFPKAAKAAADLSKQAVMATVNAVKALISGLAALVGGGVLAAALCVIILIAAIIASPFGILFSNEPSRDTVPLNTAVSQINMELTDRLADLQAVEYDTIHIQGQIPNWQEVVAVFAAKTAGSDDGVDVAFLTPDRVNRLRTVFWDMCGISAQEEDIDHPATGTDEVWTEKKLTITITAKAAEDMRTAYRFSDF